MTDTLKEIKEQMQGISLVAHEASEERHTREKRNIIVCFTCIIITLVIALIATNLAWILYDKSMETVTETFTTETIAETYEGIEQNTENGGANVIGGDVNG
jgi:hypothetical protein